MVTTRFLDGYPRVNGHRLITGSRTHAQVVVEVGPVACIGKTVGHHEPNRTIDGCREGVGAVSILRHFHSITRIPSISEWLISYKIVCCL